MTGRRPSVASAESKQNLAQSMSLFYIEYADSHISIHNTNFETMYSMSNHQTREQYRPYPITFRVRFQVFSLKYFFCQKCTLRYIIQFVLVI